MSDVDAAGPFGALHHIGIAVSDLQPVADRLVALLAGEIVDRGEDAELAASWLWIAAPGSPIIELIAPKSDEGAIARFLRNRSQGLHHVSFSPVNSDAAKAHTRSCGLEIFGESAHHDQYAELFVSPALSGGALLRGIRAASRAAWKCVRIGTWIRTIVHLMSRTLVRLTPAERSP